MIAPSQKLRAALTTLIVVVATIGLILWRHAGRQPSPESTGGKDFATAPANPAATSSDPPAAPEPAKPPLYNRPEADTRAIIREISNLDLPEGTGHFRAESFTIPPDKIRAFYEAFLASLGKEGYRRFKGAMVAVVPLPNGRSIPTDGHGNAAVSAAHGRMVQFSAEGFSYNLFFDLEDGDVILTRHSWDRD